MTQYVECYRLTVNYDDGLSESYTTERLDALHRFGRSITSVVSGEKVINAEVVEVNSKTVIALYAKGGKKCDAISYAAGNKRKSLSRIRRLMRALGL